MPKIYGKCLDQASLESSVCPLGVVQWDGPWPGLPPTDNRLRCFTQAQAQVRSSKATLVLSLSSVLLSCICC